MIGDIYFSISIIKSLSYNFIVENIDKLTKSNSMSKDKNNEVDLSQIAIISKKRADLSIFAELLKNKNIPYQIDEGKSIFTIRASILIYFYLKTLDNHILNSDKLFGILLSSPFEIDLNDYNRLLMEQRINQKDFITNMEYLLEKENEFVDVKKIKDFLYSSNLLIVSSFCLIASSIWLHFLSKYSAISFCSERGG